MGHHPRFYTPPLTRRLIVQANTDATPTTTAATATLSAPYPRTAFMVGHGLLQTAYHRRHQARRGDHRIASHSSQLTVDPEFDSGFCLTAQTLFRMT